MNDIESNFNNIIKVKSLGKKFGDLEAVKNISFEVKEGEIFGFLGPNGAGKTTNGFQMVIQIFVFPMLFLSGAFFPINGLPVWMNFLVIINPLTYSIDRFKKIILEADKLTPALKQVMGLNLTFFGHQITLFNEILFILILSIIFVTLATIKFSHNS